MSERAERIFLESAFDDLRQIAEAIGTYRDVISFEHIRWLHLSGAVDGEFVTASVGAEKDYKGVERPFTFRGYLENLNKLLINAEGGLA